ncbi:MAG: substrate-binding domain-containing protein [Pseudomonadota bacterium]
MRFTPIILCLMSTLIGATSAVAQENKTVILRSLDGFTQLRGEILSFDGKTFSIETGLGIINVNALQVECEGEACPQNLLFGAEFGVYGSNTIGATLMPALIQGYADKMEASLQRDLSSVDNEETLRIIHQNGKEMAAIDLRAHGSGTASSGLADGEATIGMASRRLKDSEAASLRASGVNELRDTQNEHILALDGLIIITNPDNPLNSIELDELPYVFSGEVTNWSELGGPDQEIVLFARDNKSGTFDTFDTLVMDPAAEAISPDARRFESNAELSDAVSRTPGALGFTGAAFARAAKVLNLRQGCGIISEPNTFSMKTEEYPLSRRLFLYDLPGDAPAHSRQLLDYALSDDAQGIVEESGFVSLDEERVALANQGQRLVHAIVGESEFSLNDMRAMLTELKDAERLSITFRFNQGTNLDARSVRDAERLAQAIAAGAYPGKEVLLVGFTDSIGQADLNRSLSLRRANEVYQNLANALGPAVLGQLPVTTLGFGEIAPVGCNTTFSGRENNRRVEVWLSDLNT